MSAFESDRKDTGNRVKSGMAPVVLGGALLATVQSNIANYKAAEANSQHMLTITEPAQLAELYPLAFVTDVLRATSTLTDPVTGAKISNAVAVEVTEERYKRRRRSSGWRTVNTLRSQARAQMGTLFVGTGLLANNAQDIDRKLELSLLDRTTLTRYYGPISTSTHIAYKSSRHRYVYRYVPDGQRVTAIAKVDAVGYGYSLIASPLMPASYPAFEPGEVSPKQYMNTLRSRFTSTMLAAGGALFLMGWFMIAILRSTSGSLNKLPMALGAIAAAGSAVAALGVWYITVSWFIGLASWLALTLGFYFLLQNSSPRKEF
jgi:hypothetical protein